MLLSLCFGVSLFSVITISNGVTNFDDSMLRRKENGIHKVDISEILHLRKPRSPLKIAIGIINTLLKGATEVRRTKKRPWRRFHKTGGQEQAWQDFEKLNVKNYRYNRLPNGEFFKTGTFGDRAVIYHSHNERNIPTITISEKGPFPNKKETIEIEYY